MYDIQHFFICCPSDSTVSKDAGIKTQDSCDYGIGCQTLTTRLDLILTLKEVLAVYFKCKMLF